MQWSSGGERKDPNTIAWMVLLFLLTSATLVYNFVLQQWLVGGVFVMLLVVLIWYFVSAGNPVNIVITNLGIQVDKQFYSFENIKGYWHSERTSTFYIEPKKRTGLVASFPMGSKKIEDIKKNLPDYISEIEGRGEDVIDRVSRLFKR